MPNLKFDITESYPNIISNLILIYSNKSYYQKTL